MADHLLTRPEEVMRFRGYRGGFISPHRALLFSPMNPRKIVSSTLLVAVWLGIYYIALDWIAGFWNGVIWFWADALGIAERTGTVGYELWGIFFNVPYLQAAAGLPTTLLWWIGVAFTLALVIISLLLPRRFIPISYFLRIVALFQGCSQIFFAFWPEAFPYSAGGYIHTMLIAGLMIVPLAPIVLGFTYYLFDFSLGRKIGLTAMLMIHLIVLIPMQYVVHAWVMYHASLLFLPVLFFVAGIPLNVLVFIVLYSWGFSWKNNLQEQQVQLKARRRFV
jgi:hypothetical protein